MASVGPTESVGGDIKFLRLKQRAIGGLVTDGSVRDTDEIINYGFPCFAYSTTARQGPAAMQPWSCNQVVTLCTKGPNLPVVCRPGDAIVGDQDGVVVVPAKVAEMVYDIAHGREVIEEIVKEQLKVEECPPGEQSLMTPFSALPFTFTSLPSRLRRRTRENDRENNHSGSRRQSKGSVGARGREECVHSFVGTRSVRQKAPRAAPSPCRRRGRTAPGVRGSRVCGRLAPSPARPMRSVRPRWVAPCVCPRARVDVAGVSIVRSLAAVAADGSNGVTLTVMTCDVRDVCTMLL